MHELKTVEYPGEDPPSVTYRRPVDQALIEYLYQAGMRIREAHAMLQEMLNPFVDPIDADGAEFELGRWLDVPPPDAKVDLREAWQETERQARTCQMLLSGEVDRAVVVLKNSIQWMEFWSVRAPTPEYREMFADSLRRLLKGPVDV